MMVKNSLKAQMIGYKQGGNMTRNLQCIAAVFLALLCVACKGSGKSKDISLGDYFPVPPGILTVDGRDPGSAYKPLPIADIYWSQTNSERGYVLDRSGQINPSADFFHFYTAVTGVPGGYKLCNFKLAPDRANHLKWTEIPQLDPDTSSFYISSGYFEHDIGPLKMLYDNDSLESDHLTIVVTDLNEQGLAVTKLAELIYDKLKDTSYAAAAIAVKLPFNGMDYVPSPDGFREMPGTLINGLKPFYVVVSGPKTGVNIFLNHFKETAEKTNLLWYYVSTAQRGSISTISLSEDAIPLLKSAKKTDFSKIDRAKRLMDDIWNIRTDRNDEHEGLPDVIWNMDEVSKDAVEHIGVLDSSGTKLEILKENLAARLYRYNKVGAGTKKGHGLWQLVVNFKMPDGIDVSLSNLTATVENYRYLEKPAVIPSPENQPGNQKKKSKKSKEEPVQNEALPVWQSNKTFIPRDFAVGQPIFLDSNETIQVYVAPKDTKRGNVQSSIICFDIVVNLKTAIVIPDWVADFDTPDGKTAAKTYNFREFVMTLLKGGSTDDQFLTDELIRIPVVLFDMPSVAINSRRK
jgi:hypothetical protein